MTEQERHLSVFERQRALTGRMVGEGGDAVEVVNLGVPIKPIIIGEGILARRGVPALIQALMDQEK